MHGKASIPKISRARAGRPRRLTIEAIIDAAEAVGLDELDMGRVAERLDVGVATLYGYVKGVDQLRRYVLARHVKQQQMEDVGQSWQDALRAYAGNLYNLYVSEPQFILHVMNNEVGVDAEADYVDGLLGLLMDRGFSPEDAVALYGEITLVATGAAVGAAYRRKAGDSGAFEKDLRGTFARREPGELTALRRCAEARIAMTSFSDFQAPLERVLADYDRRLNGGVTT